ncbi:DUF2207 domain-containing protein [Candidatus Saccharibacteria bacterium TM7i]|nr:DUF2207 domain-containing protein [Candidatus Saccharibacteria bacterium TM7i]
MKWLGGLAAFIAVLAGSLLIHSGTVGAQGLNAFVIESYNIEYKLSRDPDRRSVLEAHETIKANFTRPNTNHGIERTIPNQYKGHPTSLKIISVKDERGQSVAYSTSSVGDATTLRIGDADTYVYGEKTYDITYTQRDVTHYFENTGRTEWYWDTNGVQWRVPIQNLTVAIFLDSSIRGELQDTPKCYYGYSGSTTQCAFNDESGVYRLSLQGLRSSQNATVAFGFTKDAFAPYQKSFFDTLVMIWIAIVIITSILGFVAAIALVVIYSRKTNRTKELKPIPVEYIPPRGVSVMTAGQIVTPLGSVFGAQLIDFAVRHYIEIIETRPKSGWRPAEYDIHIIRDASELLAEEQEILSDMFGHVPAVGERLALKSLRYDYAYSARTMDNDRKLSDLIDGEYALRSKDVDPEGKLLFRRWALALLIIGLITLSPFLLFAALISFILSFTLKPLTDKGLALRRYLMGLDIYIKAAEVDRIRMLQGPDTAEKVGASLDPNDSGQLVKLYERVLPYAIFFGREKEWTKRLGEFYTQTGQSPEWYSGSSTFNAVAFSSAISSFSYAASSSSGSSSSSSSGGSSGGGSSGGGGGGGGGGGW